MIGNTKVCEQDKSVLGLHMYIMLLSVVLVLATPTPNWGDLCKRTFLDLCGSGDGHICKRTFGHFCGGGPMGDSGSTGAAPAGGAAPVNAAPANTC